MTKDEDVLHNIRTAIAKLDDARRTVICHEGDGPAVRSLVAEHVPLAGLLEVVESPFLPPGTAALIIKTPRLVAPTKINYANVERTPTDT